MNAVTEAERPAAQPIVQHHHRRIPLVWIIPFVALAIAGFLAWRTYSARGPVITITFDTGDGLEAGKTKVRNKAVDLGTVTGIELARDTSHVTATVQMTKRATDLITDHARFWVVKPRISASSVSGLDTLLSGAYVGLDPGVAGGKAARSFAGLEEPPVVQSDQPGRTFLLKADRLGSLGPGSPIYFHGLNVGEVLGYDVVGAAASVTVHAFIRAPFDAYVHPGSSFWNVSGIAITTGGDGFQIKLESLAALLSGGIAFDTPHTALDTPESAASTEFTLFSSAESAVATGYTVRVPFIAHFQQSARGLAPGAPVELYGIRVGTVTDVGLELDIAAKALAVSVHLDIEPGRFKVINGPALRDPAVIAPALIRRGLRAQLQSANLLTGQMLVALDFFPDQAIAPIAQEDGVVVLPTQPGTIQSITRSVDAMTAKLGALPLDEMVAKINTLLDSTTSILAGPELRSTLKSLQGGMADVQEVMHRVDAAATPTLRRLPDIAAGLQATVDKTSRLLGSLDTGYGDNSQFKRDLARLMMQVNDSMRSIRVLADFLDQHPEALIRGRADK